MKKLFVAILFISTLVFGQDETYEFIDHNYRQNSQLGFAVLKDGRMIILRDNLEVYNKHGKFLKNLPVKPLGNIYISYYTPQIGYVQPAEDGGFYVIGNNSKLYTFDQELLPKDSIHIELEDIRSFVVADSNIYIFSGQFSESRLTKISIGEASRKNVKFSSMDSFPTYRSRGIRVSDKGDILIYGNRVPPILFDKDFNVKFRKETRTIYGADFDENENLILVYMNKIEIVDYSANVTDSIPLQIGDLFIDDVEFSNGKLFLLCSYEISSRVPKRRSILKVLTKYGHLISESNLVGYYTDLKTMDYVYAIGNYSRLKANLDGTYSSLCFKNFKKSATPGDTLFINWYTTLQNGTVLLSYKDSLNKFYEIGSASVLDTPYAWVTPNKYQPGSTLYLSLEGEEYREQSVKIDITLDAWARQFDANEITMWVGNNGMGSHNPNTGGAGFYWPGELLTNIWGHEHKGYKVIYADGLVIGYKKNELVFVQGATYIRGLVAGIINEDGNPSTRHDKKYSILKYSADDSKLNSKDRIENNYVRNYWLVDSGAPWIDENKDGYYDPEIDKPDVPGKQLIWSTSTATDSNATQNLYGSKPDDLEIHTYVFDIDKTEFKDVVFKRYKIINKSDETMESVYLGYWSDPDLGSAGDDYVGCDTVLNLSFTFNGDNNDEGFFGEGPPAVGYQLLKGPVADSPGSNRSVNKSQNLPLTSFVIYISGSDVYRDPDLGTYNGSLMMYNNLMGKVWDGRSFINPRTNTEETLIFSGDPVSKTGWYEGWGAWPKSLNPADRRMLMSSGPFTMEPGDTQDVVYAIMLARGADNIDSITELRKLAGKVSSYYNNNQIFKGEEKPSILPVPDNYTLYQNYPNPFNPATTITFDLAKPGDVKLEIFNILGQKINTYVKRGLGYGTHSIRFDGSGLASGIYIYRIESGSFTATKKMILLK